MDSTIETRLRRLEDLAEINQLFVDYGTHLDSGDFAAYAALFADEGEVKLGPMGRATGPTAIQSMMESLLSASVGETFHVISSPVVTLHGDCAEATVMWTVVKRGVDGQPTLTGIGKHHDTLVRERGRWRLRSRRGTIDIPSIFTR